MITADSAVLFHVGAPRPQRWMLNVLCSSDGEVSLKQVNTRVTPNRPGGVACGDECQRYLERRLRRERLNDANLCTAVLGDGGEGERRCFQMFDRCDGRRKR